MQIGLLVKLGIWYMEPRWLFTRNLRIFNNKEGAFIYQLDFESHNKARVHYPRYLDTKNYEQKVFLFMC